MHTVEVLEEAIALARKQGIVVRQDWFGGSAAGTCELNGRRWVLIDLALPPREQLEIVLEALRACAALDIASTSAALRGVMAPRRAA